MYSLLNRIIFSLYNPNLSTKYSAIKSMKCFHSHKNPIEFSYIRLFPSEGRVGFIAYAVNA